MRIIRSIRRSLALFALLAAWAAAPCLAGVVVVSNRTGAKAEYSLIAKNGSAEVHELLPYASDMLPTPDAVTIEITEDGETRRYRAAANSIQYLHRPADKTLLVPVNLPNCDPSRGPAPGFPSGRMLPVLKIPVMLLVDDKEPAVRRLWEKRLRDRLEAASAIFEKTCRARFEVVAVSTWVSDSTINDFDKSLAEFEAKVAPAPARLAIGFTSHYQIPKGQTHLGGTRGPFASHILIREWSNRVTQRERLEILVHELGHYLGAAHCAEPFSVMRPLLGDRKSNAKDFQIAFDPGNIFAMALICEQVAASGNSELPLMPPATKAYLRGVYRAMEQTLPKDNAAPQCLVQLDRDPIYLPLLPFPKPVVEATRKVVQSVAAAAERNSRLSWHAAAPGGAERLEGDRLLELYVRTAAETAQSLPKEIRNHAFLYGLGVGVDHSSLLREAVILRDLTRAVESEPQRKQRLAVLNGPTMHRRQDLAQHFVVSCALTAIAGAKIAETLGIDKEVQDSIGATGLSFRDLSADLAGTSFATAVLSGKIDLAKLSADFTVADFMPDSSELPEGMSWHDFSAKFGSVKDERFQRELTAIRQQVAALPGYQAP